MQFVPDPSDLGLNPDSSGDLVMPKRVPLGCDEQGEGASFTDTCLWANAILRRDEASQRDLIEGIVRTRDVLSDVNPFRRAEYVALPLLVGIGSDQCAAAAVSCMRDTPELSAELMWGCLLLSRHSGIPQERRLATQEIVQAAHFSTEAMEEPSSFSAVENALLRQIRINTGTVGRFNALFARETLSHAELPAGEWERRGECVAAICSSNAMGAVGTLGLISLAWALEACPQSNRERGLESVLLAAGRGLSMRPAWLNAILIKCIEGDSSSQLIGALARKEPVVREMAARKLLDRVVSGESSEVIDAIGALYWAVSAWGVAPRIAREHGLARFDSDCRDLVFTTLRDLALSSNSCSELALCRIVDTAVVAATSKVEAATMLLELLKRDNLSPVVRRSFLVLLLMESPKLVDAARFAKHEREHYRPNLETFEKCVALVGSYLSSSAPWLWEPALNGWRESTVVPLLRRLSAVPGFEARYILPVFKLPGDERRRFARSYFEVVG